MTRLITLIVLDSYPHARACNVSSDKQMSRPVPTNRFLSIFLLLIIQSSRFPRHRLWTSEWAKSGILYDGVGRSCRSAIAIGRPEPTSARCQLHVVPFAAESGSNGSPDEWFEYTFVSALQSRNRNFRAGPNVDFTNDQRFAKRTMPSDWPDGYIYPRR